MGAWLTEGDARDFIDESTGYPVALRRGPAGAWCGYVGVPADHALHGKGYSHKIKAPEGWAEREGSIDDVGVINVFCADADEIRIGVVPVDLCVRCHGGLTYAGEGWWDGDDRATWWFGFDCAHSGDLSPKYPIHGDEIYRNVEYAADAARRGAADLAVLANAEAR
jgi:hypothetical protein